MFLNRQFIIALCLSCSVGLLPGCASDKKSGISEEQMDDVDYIPQLQERTGSLAQASDWPRTKTKVSEMTTKIKASPRDVRPRLQLAMIYISEARITGNADYYQSIFKILDDVQKIQPKNFEALVFKASVKMSQHQFADAKKLAEEARAINPDNAYVYGVLVDANVELGNYKEAVAMSDKMQSLKPSLEAYSRVSYLREIYGDYPGSIEVMKMAVQAGQPGLESDEWARTTLADLYLSTGKLDEAKALYEQSLEFRPQYPQAEIGLAKIEKARKNYPAAIEHTRKAIQIVSETAFVSLLGDLYALNGEKDKAQQTHDDVVRLLEEAEKQQPADASVRHNPNRELAQAYLNDRKLDKALDYAKKDLAMRPNNIDANELTAWILYQQGNYAEAKQHVDKMLQTNTRNASTLYKAGMILAKAGDAARGNQLVAEADAVNPYLDPMVKRYAMK